MFLLDVNRIRTTPSVAAMVQAIQAGEMGWERDQEAAGTRAATPLDDIGTLVALYRPRVSRFLLFSLNDDEAAESLTQECFLRAYRSRSQFRGECHVSTWLLRIAHNLLRDHTGSQKFRFWRKVRRESLDAAEIAHRLAGPAQTAEAQMLTRERLACVWAAVSTLSPHQRSVFLLHFVEGFEIEEIVQSTGMKAGTVKSHLHRALTGVRRHAESEGLLAGTRRVARPDSAKGEGR